jgi:hypothetical protein
MREFVCLRVANPHLNMPQLRAIRTDGAADRTEVTEVYSAPHIA